MPPAGQTREMTGADRLRQVASDLLGSVLDDVQRIGAAAAGVGSALAAGIGRGAAAAGHLGSALDAGIGVGITAAETLKNAVTGAFQLARQAAADLGRSMWDALGPNTQALASGLGQTLSAGLGAAMTAASAFADSFGTITKLVGVFNPALVEQLQYAFQDLMGVLGAALMPIVQIVTEGVRMVGDALATILPEISSLLEPVIDVLGVLLDALRPILDLLVELAPLITSVLKPVLNFIVKVVEIIAAVIKAIAGALSSVLRFLGLTSEARERQSSRGFAAREGQVGTLQSASQRIQQAALRGPNIPEQQLAQLVAINRTLTDSQRVLEQSRRPVIGP